MTTLTLAEPADRRIEIDRDLPAPSWKSDPALNPGCVRTEACFLLKVITTNDGITRTVGTLTGGMYANPEIAMEVSGSTVWTRHGDEWRSSDGEWIVRRAMT